MNGELLLEAHGLGFHYPGGAPVLNDLSLAIPRGSILGIVGPNGAGKSTLLHLLSGALQPTAGETRLAGRRLAEWPRRDAARRIAVVPQTEPFHFAWRVRDIVMMGRTPWLTGLLAAERPADHEAVDRALDLVDMTTLADRPITQLSGGERQMVLVARALAQEAEILLLDEPTASLDLAHQQQLFRLLMRQHAERGITVVVVTHDLNLAALYAARMAVLHGGRIAAEGTPAGIMTGELLSRIYRAGLWTSTSPAGAPIVGLVR